MAVDTILQEVADAEAAGLKPEELQTMRGQIIDASGVGASMAFSIPESDTAAWVAAWRLELDIGGVERGYPTKLPRLALGYYLSKRRPIDGGRLFSLAMPEHLEAERKFQCFVVPNICKAKLDTKSNLVDHMEAAHPRESAAYRKEIQQIRDSASEENPALQAIIAQIVSTPDPSRAAVAPEVREAYDATLPELDLTAGVETLITAPAPACVLCAWPVGSVKWANKTPTQQALKMHIFAKHKSEVE